MVGDTRECKFFTGRIAVVFWLYYFIEHLSAAFNNEADAAEVWTAAEQYGFSVLGSEDLGAAELEAAFAAINNYVCKSTAEHRYLVEATFTNHRFSTLYSEVGGSAGFFVEIRLFHNDDKARGVCVLFRDNPVPFDDWKLNFPFVLDENNWTAKFAEWGAAKGKRAAS